jgi:hypothetical protein
MRDALHDRKALTEERFLKSRAGIRTIPEPCRLYPQGAAPVNLGAQSGRKKTLVFEGFFCVSPDARRGRRGIARAGQTYET